MLGEMATNGNFSALLLHQIAKAWKVKINAQVSNERILSVMYIYIHSCQKDRIYRAWGCGVLNLVTYATPLLLSPFPSFNFSLALLWQTLPTGAGVEVGGVSGVP